MSYQNDASLAQDELQTKELMEFSINESNTDKAFEVIFSKVNIFQKNDHLVVQIDLDGIDPDDVHVMASTKSLVLYLNKEHSGNLIRVVSLPIEVIANLAEADFQDGLLSVSIPKAKTSKVVVIRKDNHK